MTVTVYVNWEEHEILTKEQFKEEVEGLVENINKDHDERRERIWGCLEYKELDWGDLFDMSETDRQELKKEFEEWLVGDAEEQLLHEEYGEVELEL